MAARLIRFSPEVLFFTAIYAIGRQVSSLILLLFATSKRQAFGNLNEKLGRHTSVLPPPPITYESPPREASMH